MVKQAALPRAFQMHAFQIPMANDDVESSEAQEFDSETVKRCVVFELRQTVKIPTAAATILGSPKARP